MNNEELRQEPVFIPFDKRQASPMTDSNNFHERNILVIRKTIGALTNINSKLLERRKTSIYIPRLEFQSMVNDAKALTNDVEVSKRLDEIFEEYLPKKETLPKVPNTNEALTKKPNLFNSELIDKTKTEISNQIDSLNEPDEYQDKGETKGPVKSYNNGKFKNNEWKDNKAA